MKDYNTTQLNPETTFKKHVFHRDQFAHYLRWSHVLKRAKIGMNILDVGCGSGNLAEVLYRNRYKGEKYLGLEYKKSTVARANEKYENVSWIEFQQHDAVKDPLPEGDWDIITSFEVIEHIQKENADAFLGNIKSVMGENTTFLLSTPVYDPRVGAAQNHIIDGKVCEFGFEELREILERYFTIDEVYGTFASQRDYVEHLPPEERKVYDKLHKYYDSQLLACILAPLHPEKSRNAIWVLKKK